MSANVGVFLYVCAIYIYEICCQHRRCCMNCRSRQSTNSNLHIISRWINFTTTKNSLWIVFYNNQNTIRFFFNNKKLPESFFTTTIKNCVQKLFCLNYLQYIDLWFFTKPTNLHMQTHTNCQHLHAYIRVTVSSEVVVYFLYPELANWMQLPKFAMMFVTARGKRLRPFKVYI